MASVKPRPLKYYYDTKVLPKSTPDLALGLTGISRAALQFKIGIDDMTLDAIPTEPLTRVGFVLPLAAEQSA